jgi:hypothetical protein
VMPAKVSSLLPKFTAVPLGGLRSDCMYLIHLDNN